MRRVLLILIVAAIVVGVSWWVAGLPGDVIVRAGGVTYQGSVPVTAFGLALLFIVLHLLVRLIGGLIRLPRRLRLARERRHRRLGDIAVTRTLVALAAGEGDDARREAGRARRFLGDTPQTLLLTAEADRQAGRTSESEATLRQLAERQDAAFLGLRGLLREAVARQDWAAAAELARRAEAAHPGASWLRAERWQLALRSGAWKEALALAPADGPAAALGAAAADAATDPEEGRRLAKRAFESDPALPAGALAYARRLREAGKESRAQDVLRRAWAANPQPELADFALRPLSDPLARVKAAASLVSGNRDHAESHLLLGRLSLDAGLTGEARRHAEAARHLANQRRIWMLLADIEEAEGGDTEAGRLAQRQALRSAATAGPDPSWRCGACGTTHVAWHPVCPSCHAPGRIAWAQPPAPAVLLPAERSAQAGQ